MKKQYILSVDVVERETGSIIHTMHHPCKGNANKNDLLDICAKLFKLSASSYQRLDERGEVVQNWEGDLFILLKIKGSM